MGYVCVLQWMADHVDLILVFFDPIGKPGCRALLSTAWNVEQPAGAPHSADLSVSAAMLSQVLLQQAVLVWTGYLASSVVCV